MADLPWGLNALCRRLARPLNFEMAVTDEMREIGLRILPHAACLVPERREERTTEGGLDAAWCEALAEGRADDAAAIWEQLHAGAHLADDLGLEVHAGHGLDFDTARTIAAIPQIKELNIGHFLIGEAIFTGLAPAIALMRKAMDEGRADFDHRHRL